MAMPSLQKRASLRHQSGGVSQVGTASSRHKSTSSTSLQRRCHATSLPVLMRVHSQPEGAMQAARILTHLLLLQCRRHMSVGEVRTRFGSREIRHKVLFAHRRMLLKNRKEMNSKEVHICHSQTTCELSVQVLFVAACLAPSAVLGGAGGVRCWGGRVQSSLRSRRRARQHLARQQTRH